MRRRREFVACDCDHNRHQLCDQAICLARHTNTDADINYRSGGTQCPAGKSSPPRTPIPKQDKEQLSEAITSIYADYAGLPEFYVVVIFHDKPANSIYVGGKAANQLRAHPRRPLRPADGHR